MGKVIAKKIRGMNWMAKISLVLIFTLVFGGYFVHTGLLPSSAASGDVILLWDTANGAVPAGWTNISGLPGDAYYGVFPRAAATYGAATAGSDTHTHSLTFSTTTGPSASTTTSDATASADEANTNNHTHTWGNITSGAGDVRPPFKNLVFIQANNPATIPSNAIAIFDTGSLPSGWTRYAALDNNYLRGFSDNTTGGSATHTHTANQTSGALATFYIKDAGNNTSVSRSDHTHDITGSLTTTGTNAQPFVQVVFARNSSGGAVAIPDGLIAMFNATPPAGWTTVSNAAPWSGNFLRGAATFGTTGGSSADHNHGASQTFTSGAASSNRNISSGTGRTPATDTHTHNATYTIANSGNPLPVYRDTIFAKKAGTPGSLQFTSATFSVNENAGPASVTVSRTGGSTGAVSVTCATVAGGTATAVTDYTTTSTVLSWPDGDSANKTCSIPITNDALDETNETVNLQLSGATGGATIGAQSTATLTINDDDPTPSLSINDVTQAEGNSGTSTFIFTVTLSAASGQTVTVNYATADGTATAGSDYVAIGSTVLTFNPGDTTKTINVTVNGDTTSEGNEQFSVNLSGAVNATISDNQGVGTITNDDVANTPPTLSISQPDGLGDTVIQGASYNVTYTLTDPDSVATAAFFYDTDNTGLNGTAISGACASAAEGSPGSCSWNTTGVPAGTYYVYGIATDGVNPTVNAYSPGQITITPAPVNTTTAGTATALAGDKSIEVTAPYTNDANGNNTLLIEWGLNGIDYSVGSMSLPHGPSPYTYTIPNLSNGTSYQVRVTYQDANGVTGTAVQTFANLTPANPLQHNSSTTGSTKWGGWGLAGAKYGEFVCETCHTTNAPNIKRIKGTITAPNGTDQFPGQLGGTPIVFDRVSGVPGNPGTMGDDSSAPRSSSNKICEYCHTYDATQASGTNVHAYNQQVASGHSDAADCTDCHKHKEGFKKGGVCNSCHGAPPGTDPDTNAPAVYAASHGTHYNAAAGGLPTSYSAAGNRSIAGAYVFDCGNCHSNIGTTHGTGETDGIVNVLLPAGGAWTPGNYTGGDNTPPPGTVTFKNSNGTCSSVYCHGNFAGNGNNATPIWGDTASAACGTCHDVDTSPTMDGGSHQVHAKQQNFMCDFCHSSTSNGVPAIISKAKHADGKITWDLGDGTYSQLTASSTYKGSNAGESASVGGPYGSCDTIYCHSNVQTSPPTGNNRTYQSPAPVWGGSVTCGSCHKAGPVGPGAEQDTGSHLKHVSASQYNKSCSQCHQGAGSGTTNHANYQINVAINSTWGGSYNGTAAPGDAYGSCSSVSCHSTVQAADGSGLPTFKNVTWGTAGPLACDACHGNTGATLSTTAHNRHLNNTIHGTIDCVNCHNGYQTGTPPNHANNAINVALSTVATMTGTYSDAAGAPRNGLGTCSTTYCHSTVQDVDGVGAGTDKPIGWGTAGPLACNACHGNTAATLTTGSHPDHLTAGYACADCHKGFDGGNTTAHANALINVDLTNRGATATYSGNTTPQSGAFGSCSATTCHGGTSDAWGTDLSTYDNCTICHGTKTVAADGSQITANPQLVAPPVDTAGNSGNTDAQVGTHQEHILASHNLSSPIACNQCHTVPASVGATGHLFDGTNDTTAGVAEVKANLAGTLPGGLGSKLGTLNWSLTYTAPGGSCSNTYCHDGRNFKYGWSTAAQIDFEVPDWNTPMLAEAGNAKCNNCHGYPPAGSHPADSNCVNCHNHVNATNDGFTVAGKTMHVDGNVQGGGDCIGCHTGMQNDAANTDIGNNGVRAIIPEFSKQSHHVSGRAATKFDCVVCHAEGDVSTGETNASHKNGQIDLRDVDSATATFTWTGTQYYNLNNHCLSCHDSNGANVVRNADPAVTTETAANPFGSSRTNTYDQQVRTAVVDVRSQFATGSFAWPTNDNTYSLTGFTGASYNGNPSQHAVLGPRYQTNVITAGKWTSTTLQSGQTPRDNVRLFCGDCHTLGDPNIGAHGSNNEYMLKNSSGTDAEYTAETDDNCFICHASGSYNGTTSNHGPANGSDYAYTNTATGTARATAKNAGNLSGSACLNCHSGGTSGWGGIHGASGTYTDVNNGTQTKYRFFPGFGNRGYIPVGGWNGSPDVTCYTPGTAIGGTTWSGCDQHTGSGVTRTGVRNPRATAY